MLLLEYGGSDRSIYIQMPSALSIPMNMPKYNWFYHTEPEPHLDGRRMHTPRGKVLGGSSSINGLVYIRGNPQDFERWAAEGATGWAYRDVLPYFKRAERRQEGGDRYRGDAGKLDDPLRIAEQSAACGVACGRRARRAIRSTTDVNGFQQEGFGRMDMTVGEGRRCSAANAYLRPAIGRPNLDGHHPRARHPRAVRGTPCPRTRVRRAAGKTHRVRSRQGAHPVGGADQLAAAAEAVGCRAGARNCALGIAVVQDLPGVGENLQDHLEFYFQVACKEPITLYSSINPWSRVLIGARWLLRKDGLGATNHFETCGFIRSRAGIEYPDIQYHFLPMAVAYDGSSLAQEHGFQAHVGPMRSKSRGWVRLASANPLDKPRILFNYLSQPDDWAEMRACVRLTREIFAQAGLRPISRAGDSTGHRCAERRANRRLHPRQDRDRLSPLLLLQDGRGARPHGGGRSANARPWTRRAACGGFLHHALDHHRQFECAHHHAGRESRRSHSRPGHAAADDAPFYRARQLAKLAALSRGAAGSRM